jgi:hypothetical protein
MKTKFNKKMIAENKHYRKSGAHSVILITKVKIIFITGREVGGARVDRVMRLFTERKQRLDGRASGNDRAAGGRGGAAGRCGRLW